MNKETNHVVTRTEYSLTCSNWDNEVGHESAENFRYGIMNHLYDQGGELRGARIDGIYKRVFADGGWETQSNPPKQCKHLTMEEHAVPNFVSFVKRFRELFPNTTLAWMPNLMAWIYTIYDTTGEVAQNPPDWAQSLCYHKDFPITKCYGSTTIPGHEHMDFRALFNAVVFVPDFVVIVVLLCTLQILSSW